MPRGAQLYYADIEHFMLEVGQFQVMTNLYSCRYLTGVNSELSKPHEMLCFL